MKDGLLLYPRHFDSNANNDEHQFKINDLFIAAYSLDITENELSLFEDNQIIKFKEAIDSKHSNMQL